jgi:nicotinate-nucleotide adenylyltransferase
MKIGVLGGSFDPVHFGHIGIARATGKALALGKVLLMPAAQAPLRTLSVRASGAQRVAMLRLALADLVEQEGEPCLEVSELELQREGVSYTVDTLRALRSRHPNDEFTWIIGEDQLARIAEWREPTELARLADWAVYRRPGYAESDAPSLPNLRLRRIAAPLLWPVSSSELRVRLAAGESIVGLVADKVIEYIHDNGLYRPD